MSDNEIIQAFHLMWGNFPEAVMITQKSREIIAVNKAAEKFGLKPGIKCSSIGKPENHMGCQCNRAVDSGQPVFVTYEGNFGKAYGFWIPIEEKPEWVIHFGVGYAFEYEKISRGKVDKKMDSFHGLTKGTELEPTIKTVMQAEANGTMMYYALARLAKEQGFDDIAQTFIESANQEAVHAGFYATLNGKYPKDFWKLAETVMKAEYTGEKQVKDLAEKVRAAGFAAAADEMEIFAKQERHHGEVLEEIIKKYKPADKKSDAAKKVYVCPVCGYEYEGDINSEPDDWTCPLCGQPKSAFIEKGKSPLKIKAVKFYENGFMTQPFACGLEDGEDKFDAKIKYRSCLQNFVIDTGDEVILVDTGLPAETPDQVVDEKTQIFVGEKIEDYVDALKNLGYKPEDVSKILITHKHPDHTGELRSFPNAKIYISRVEADAMNLSGENVVRVDFTDGAYKNFDKSQKICDGIYYIFAPGHTTGNSIVIVEDGGLFYIIHGDVTYTDEALYMNKLSIATEDKAAARDTLNKVREFIKNNPTVYVSTHTPLGYENLENKKVVDLDKMPEPIPPKEVAAKAATGKYICSICGYVYDPAEHDGVKFEDLPDDWKCPICKNGKDKFNKA